MKSQRKGQPQEVNSCQEYVTKRGCVPQMLSESKEAGGAVMSGLVEGLSEAPDGSQLAKPVAKELFPACKPARDENGEPLEG